MKIILADGRFSNLNSVTCSYKRCQNVSVNIFTSDVKYVHSASSIFGCLLAGVVNAAMSLQRENLVRFVRAE
jgi:hypothetical protein